MTRHRALEPGGAAGFVPVAEADPRGFRDSPVRLLQVHATVRPLPGALRAEQRTSGQWGGGIESTQTSDSEERHLSLTNVSLNIHRGELAKNTGQHAAGTE